MYDACDFGSQKENCSVLAYCWLDQRRVARGSGNRHTEIPSLSSVLSSRHSSTRSSVSIYDTHLHNALKMVFFYT
jgi:hypothetical protein